MNLTILVGKEGASAARWKGAFLGIVQAISEKYLGLYWIAIASSVSKAGAGASFNDIRESLHNPLASFLPHISDERQYI
ncbi:MAG: hypothetical protein O2966_00760 [Proteobacteria bacterium]|nr:hypothetical protein [Pseudomonadota bacterium]